MEQINFILTGSLPYEAALQGNLTLVDMFLITGYDCAFFVSGTGMLTTLLFLPVDSAQVGKRLTLFTLDFKAFVADPDIQTISFICPVLNRCPLFPPDGEVFSLVVLPIFLYAESIRPNRPGGYDDMDMWIVFQWVPLVPALVYGSDSAQAIAHKAIANELLDNTD